MANQPVKWITWVPSEDCVQELNISSTPTKFCTTPGDISGVTIYICDTDSYAEYYLRVNILTHEVSLECEEAFLNVSS